MTMLFYKNRKINVLHCFCSDYKEETNSNPHAKPIVMLLLGLVMFDLF